MMQVEILDNVTAKMAPKVTSLLECSAETRIAVAFLSPGGLGLLEKSIDKALSSGLFMEFLVGLDGAVTHPDALRTLHKLSIRCENLDVYCYAALENAAMYHPKVYLFSQGDKATAIVGSSNLTTGGLIRNIEANALIHGNSDDLAIEAVRSTYSYLKFHPKRVSPDAAYLDMYAELFAMRKVRDVQVVLSGSERELRTAFERKAQTLQRPKASRRDLVGWLGMVYDALPDGEFSNQQMYEHTQRFRKAYPDNRNVEAKIRQKLQELRNMGLVEDIGRGRWRKA